MKCEATVNLMRIDFDEGTFSVSRGEHRRIDEVASLLISFDDAKELARVITQQLPPEQKVSL